MKIVLRKYRIFLLFLFFVGNLANNLSAQNDFPYKLNKSDYAIVPIGLASYGIAKALEHNKNKMTFAELAQLSSADINSFDRKAIYKWNTNLDDISNVGKYTMLAAPCIMFLPQVKNREWSNTFTYGAMYFEVALLNLGITELSKSVSSRVRPYLYGDNISIADKNEIINNESVYDSFFSGHTSAAFSSAVFLSKTYSDIFGNNIWSNVIWISSLSIATTTGYLRYESGQHFPTDIIAGAIVGSAIGFVIPELHKKSNSNLSLAVYSNGFYVVYSF